MVRTGTKRKDAVQGQIELDVQPAGMVPARPATRAKLAPRYDASLLIKRTSEAASEPAVDPALGGGGAAPSRSIYADDRFATEPFGTWLVKQKDRGGLLGQLATAATGDRALSKAATPQDMRRRLVEQQADGDMHDALDDAEIDWAAL